MNELKTKGIHHITSIVGDPNENIEFYRDVLGLRLVKKTVNFDDPYTYHLYFGDETGSPGTVITFFPWGNGQQGRIGTGQVGVTMYRVPEGSLSYWKRRLKTKGIATDKVEQFGQERLLFFDPHGLKNILVEGRGEGNENHNMTPGEYRISGFEGAVLYSHFPDKTKEMLVDIFQYRVIEENENSIRLSAKDSRAKDLGRILEIDKTIKVRGLTQIGTVHHIALRVEDPSIQAKWKEKLEELGYSVSPVRDRNYFTSIYFHEPGGILFEVATDGPGFHRDEPLENLGGELMLPKEYESRRQEIEKHLPLITQEVK